MLRRPLHRDAAETAEPGSKLRRGLERIGRRVRHDHTDLRSVAVGQVAGEAFQIFGLPFEVLLNRAFEISADEPELTVDREEFDAFVGDGRNGTEIDYGRRARRDVALLEAIESPRDVRDAEDMGRGIVGVRIRRLVEVDDFPGIDR
ncbi:MAG: hypothetical protein AAF322_02115 [Pseudomonadota bacterium]